MIAASCFCGEGWNLAAGECSGGHPMTPAEREVHRLRTENALLAGDLETLRAVAQKAHAEWERDALSLDLAKAMAQLEVLMQRPRTTSGKETP